MSNKYGIEGDIASRKKWLGYLSTTKSSNLINLNDTCVWASSFQRLRLIPGLWTGVHLGILHKLKSLHLDEVGIIAAFRVIWTDLLQLFEHYLNDIWDFLMSLVRGNQKKLTKLDSATLIAIQGLAPGASSEDLQKYSELKKRGEIFTGFDNNEMEEINKEITSRKTFILTLFTFFQDVHILQQCAPYITKLLMRPRRFTVRKTLAEMFEPGRGWCEDRYDIQVTEEADRTVTADSGLRFELAYRQLWLYVIRHALRGDGRRAKQMPQETIQMNDLATFAYRLGFRSDAIEQLRRQKAKARQKVQQHATSVIVYPALPSDRYGIPHPLSLAEDRKSLFLDQIAVPPEPSEKVTTFFVLQSIYWSFFGSLDDFQGPPIQSKVTKRPPLPGVNIQHNSKGSDHIAPPSYRPPTVEDAPDEGTHSLFGQLSGDTAAIYSQVPGSSLFVPEYITSSPSSPLSPTLQDEGRPKPLFSQPSPRTPVQSISDKGEVGDIPSHAELPLGCALVDVPETETVARSPLVDGREGNPSLANVSNAKESTIPRSQRVNDDILGGLFQPVSAKPAYPENSEASQWLALKAEMKELQTVNQHISRKIDSLIWNFNLLRSLQDYYEGQIPQEQRRKQDMLASDLKDGSQTSRDIERTILRHITHIGQILNQSSMNNRDEIEDQHVIYRRMVAHGEHCRSWVQGNLNALLLYEIRINNISIFTEELKSGEVILKLSTVLADIEYLCDILSSPQPLLYRGNVVYHCVCKEKELILELKTCVDTHLRKWKEPIQLFYQYDAGMEKSAVDSLRSILQDQEQWIDSVDGRRQSLDKASAEVSSRLRRLVTALCMSSRTQLTSITLELRSQYAKIRDSLNECNDQAGKQSNELTKFTAIGDRLLRSETILEAQWKQLQQNPSLPALIQVEESIQGCEQPTDIQNALDQAIRSPVSNMNPPSGKRGHLQGKEEENAAVEAAEQAHLHGEPERVTAEAAERDRLLQETEMVIDQVDQVLHQGNSAEAAELNLLLPEMEDMAIDQDQVLHQGNPAEAAERNLLLPEMEEMVTDQVDQGQLQNKEEWMTQERSISLPQLGNAAPTVAETQVDFAQNMCMADILHESWQRARRGSWEAAQKEAKIPAEESNNVSSTLLIQTATSDHSMGELSDIQNAEPPTMASIELNGRLDVPPVQSPATVDQIMEEPKKSYDIQCPELDTQLNITPIAPAMQEPSRISNIQPPEPNAVFGHGQERIEVQASFPEITEEEKNKTVSASIKAQEFQSLAGNVIASCKRLILTTSMRGEFLVYYNKLEEQANSQLAAIQEKWNRAHAVQPTTQLTSILGICKEIQSECSEVSKAYREIILNARAIVISEAKKEAENLAQGTETKGILKDLCILPILDNKLEGMNWKRHIEDGNTGHAEVNKARELYRQQMRICGRTLVRLRTQNRIISDETIPAQHIAVPQDPQFIPQPLLSKEQQAIQIYQPQPQNAKKDIQVEKFLKHGSQLAEYRTQNKGLQDSSQPQPLQISAWHHVGDSRHVLQSEPSTSQNNQTQHIEARKSETVLQDDQAKEMQPISHVAEEISMGFAPKGSIGHMAETKLAQPQNTHHPNPCDNKEEWKSQSGTPESVANSPLREETRQASEQGRRSGGDLAQEEPLLNEITSQQNPAGNEQLVNLPKMSQQKIQATRSAIKKGSDRLVGSLPNGPNRAKKSKQKPSSVLENKTQEKPVNPEERLPNETSSQQGPSVGNEQPINVSQKSQSATKLRLESIAKGMPTWPKMVTQKTIQKPASKKRKTKVRNRGKRVIDQIIMEESSITSPPVSYSHAEEAPDMQNPQSSNVQQEYLEPRKGRKRKAGQPNAEPKGSWPPRKSSPQRRSKRLRMKEIPLPPPSEENQEQSPLFLGLSMGKEETLVPLPLEENQEQPPLPPSIGKEETLVPPPLNVEDQQLQSPLNADGQPTPLSAGILRSDLLQVRRTQRGERYIKIWIRFDKIIRPITFEISPHNIENLCECFIRHKYIFEDLSIRGRPKKYIKTDFDYNSFIKDPHTSIQRVGFLASASEHKTSFTEKTHEIYCKWLAACKTEDVKWTPQKGEEWLTAETMAYDQTLPEVPNS